MDDGDTDGGEGAERREYSSGTEWEEAFNYSRAVRVGDTVRVSGTTAVDEGETVAPNDAGPQAAFVYERIGEALGEVGAEPADVVAVRAYVTDVGDTEPVATAHRDFFAEAGGGVRPAMTLVEVSGLVRPDLVVEIEADAVVAAGDGD
jgi:enamine deaminase RidA (YjgF/YER057c/UK114 family)